MGLNHDIRQTRDRLLRPLATSGRGSEPGTGRVHERDSAGPRREPLTADQAIAAAWRARFTRWRAEAPYEPRNHSSRRDEPHDDIVDAEIVEDRTAHPELRSNALPAARVRALPPAQPPDSLTEYLQKGARNAQQ